MVLSPPRNIPAGTLIWSEAALFTAKLSLFSDPSFMNRKEVKPLLEVVARCAQENRDKVGAAMYPPEARAALDRLTDIKAQDELRNVWSKSVNDRIMALQDVHRQRPGHGEIVVVSSNYVSPFCCLSSY